MAVKHTFHSAIADSGDPNQVSSSEWNDNHVIDAGTLTDVEVAAANKDGVAGTPSLRTLGTGATQAAAGNDSRLGANAGTHAARPAAGTNGRLYFETDTLQLYRDNGAAWVLVSVQKLAELNARAHSDLTGIGANDHHAEQHAMDSAAEHTSSDVATLDVSTSKHGFVPKAPNDTTKFLRGDATWAAPAGGGASGGTPALVLSTSNAAGAASTFIREDDQIAVFDSTVPASLGTAATGSAAFAARRDHVHPATVDMASGTSTSGTPATLVAQIVAAGSNQLVAWNLTAAQANATGTQFKVIITYTDTTSTSFSSTAASQATCFGNAGGLLVASNQTLTALSAKPVASIRVETLGTGTGARTAIISALEIGP